MTPKKIYKIGRDPHNDIVVPGGYDKTSRWHCEIEQYKDGSCQIIDVSTNGTFVNGEQIPKNVRIPISPNDSVKLADQYVLDLGFVKSPPRGASVPWLNIAIIIVALAAVGSLIFWVTRDGCLFNCKKDLQEIVADHSDDIGLIAHSFYYKTFTHNNTPVFAGYDREYYEESNELRPMFSFNYNQLLPFYLSGTGFLIDGGKNGPLLITNRHIGNPAFKFNNGQLLSQESEDGNLIRQLNDALYKFETENYPGLSPNLNREYKVHTYALRFMPHDLGINFPSNMSYKQLIDQMGVSNAQLLRWSTDPDVDIAIMSVDGFKSVSKHLLQIDKNFNFDIDNVNVGDDCFMIGFPGGLELMASVSPKIQLTALAGKISQEPKHYLIDYSIDSEGGHSGSPIFNDKGKVIAIHFAGRNTTGYGIPILHLQDVLNYTKTQSAN